MTSHPKRIAVIAVHGVADQQPGATARQVGNLLTGLERDGRHPYPAAREIPLKIAVDPVSAERADSALQRARRQEQAGEPRPKLTFLAPSVNAAIDAGVVADRKLEASWSRMAREDLAHTALQDQLRIDRRRGLPVQDRVWDTVRLELSGAEERCETHVYEMYWADLSRLGNKVYGVLFSFYQLLFFLPVLGSRSVGYARAVASAQGLPARCLGWWKAYGLLHALATRALIWGVPVLNLLILGLTTLLAVRFVALQGSWHLWWIPTVLLVVATLAVLYRSREKVRLSWIWAFLLTGLLALSLAGMVLGPLKSTPAYSGLWIAALSIWLVVLALLAWLFKAYAKRFPGAFGFWVVLASVLTVRLFVALWGIGDSRLLLDAAIEVAREAILFGHWPLWGIYALSALGSTILGIAAVRSISDRELRERFARVAWTADFSLTTPGVIVLLVDLGLWWTLIAAVKRWLGPSSEDQAVITLLSADQLQALDRIFDSAVPPMFWAGLALLLLALLLVVWSVWPAVRADAHLRSGRTLDSRWLGKNLSEAFRNARWSGELVRYLVVLGLPAAVVWWALASLAGRELAAWEVTPSWIIAGLAVALSAALLGRGPLGALAVGFRGALDVALDVINWLRNDPPGATPSGRIASRYQSLLRHVCSWRHPLDGGGYSAVVIVAHSQGTVITTDLLRFLRVEHDNRPPGLECLSEKVPLALLTMGCPLHQLYGLRFPFRYGGSRTGNEPWESCTANSPAEIGARRWWNLYHSGDYVGRYLWHPATAERGDEAWEGDKLQAGVATRRERCLGGGSHNTYLSGDSKTVAEMLDELIGTC